MADEKRAEFPDREHPLYTPDETAQAQVAERITKAMEGPRKEAFDQITEGDTVTVTDEHGTFEAVYAGAYLAPGQRAEVYNQQRGEVWGVTRQTAAKRLGHPESLSAEEVDELCDILHVGKDQLRYGMDEGRALSQSDTLAEIYMALGANDRELLYDLACRLLEPEKVYGATQRARGRGAIRV